MTWEYTAVISEIASERRRQVQAEGWTLEHDDEHQRGELAMAAAYYAVSHLARTDGRCPYAALLWPWKLEAGGGIKLKDRRRDLIRAAALIVAEIERLDRAEVQP